MRDSLATWSTSIHSVDRDPRFTAHFWKSFQKVMGTRPTMSTAFHPQTDGQSERTIQVLEDMLRAYVLDHKGSWEEHLPLVEFTYNNSYQVSIQMHRMRHCMGGHADHHYVGPRWERAQSLVLI